MFSYKNHTQRKPFIYNGLVGAWNFNNGNSKYIYDYSGYGNTSIFLGPNPSVGWGEKSKSLNLNGDYDFFEVIGEKLPPVLDLNNLTFSTWINIKSEKNASIIGNLTDKGGWLLSTILQNGLRLKFSYNKNYIEAISDFIVPTNKWIFISVSFDNKNYVKFYLNGLEKKSFFYIKFGLFCSGSSVDRLIYENFSKNNIFCSGLSSNYKLISINSDIDLKSNGSSDSYQIININSFNQSNFYLYDHIGFIFLEDFYDNYDEYSLKIDYKNSLVFFGVKLGGASATDDYFVSGANLIVGGTSSQTLNNSVGVSGALLVGGNSSKTFNDFVDIGGGLIIGGSCNEGLLYNEVNAVSVVVNGESKILFINEQIANGGAINSGVCFNETIYNIVSSGGLVVSGNSVVGFFYEQVAIGGSLAGGIGLETAVYYSFGDGGLISSVGSSQTFYSTVNVDGGCSLGGLFASSVAKTQTGDVWLYDHIDFIYIENFYYSFDENYLNL
jgi:hypothetical protein